MNTDYVSLEAAKAIKDVGFPQDQWPQMVWWRWQTFWRKEDAESALSFWRQEEVNIDWYVAPTHLAALEWLDMVKGYAVEKDSRYGWYATKDARWLEDEGEDGEVPWHTDLNSLILAICKHIKEGRDD